MGLKELFRRKTPIEKATKDLMEPYAQSDVRRAAMSTLLSMATEESFQSVLRRFTFTANGHIADEAEKRDLVEYSVDIGDEMIAPLKKYIRTEKSLSFAIRALNRLVKREFLLAFLVEALQEKEPLDHRTTDAKRALVIALGDYGSESHAEVLFPYLEDHNDDVQMQVIEALERLAAKSSTEALANVCCHDIHAARIQHRAARALMEMELSVKKHYDRFLPDVKSEFVLGKKGCLVQKSQASKSA